MSVIRIKKRSTPYVTLNTTALNDARLSFRAKGLHTYLMSKPDDWRVYIVQLEKESPKEGREAIAGALKELEAAGYIHRERIRGEKGRMAGWDTTIYETPELADEKVESTENGFAEVGSTEIGLSEVGSTEVGKPATTYNGFNQELSELKIEETTPSPPQGEAQTYSQGFLQFWETYPHHRRQAKPKCFILWKRHRLESKTSGILAQLASLKRTDQWQRGIIPSSLTWLNQGRFEDGEVRTHNSLELTEWGKHMEAATHATE